MKFPKRSLISKYKNINISSNSDYSHKSQYKPTGLWFSYYSAWYNFIISNELYDWLHKYIHSINIKSGYLTNIHNKSKSKLLVIKNNNEFDIFHKRYKVKTNEDLIDWNIVSNDYGGIEISNLVTRNNIDWYYTWDIPSGCIWNYKLIKNIKLVYVKGKNNKYNKE